MQDGETSLISKQDTENKTNETQTSTAPEPFPEQGRAQHASPPARPSRAPPPLGFPRPTAAYSAGAERRPTARCWRRHGPAGPAPLEQGRSSAQKAGESPTPLVRAERNDEVSARRYLRRQPLLLVVLPAQHPPQLLHGGAGTARRPYRKWRAPPPDTTAAGRMRAAWRGRRWRVMVGVWVYVLVGSPLASESAYFTMFIKSGLHLLSSGISRLISLSLP